MLTVGVGGLPSFASRQHPQSRPTTAIFPGSVAWSRSIRTNCAATDRAPGAPGYEQRPQLFDVASLAVPRQCIVETL